jgi:hypothetical protein
VFELLGIHFTLREAGKAIPAIKSAMRILGKTQSATMFLEFVVSCVRGARQPVAKKRPGRHREQ